MIEYAGLCLSARFGMKRFAHEWKWWMINNRQALWYIYVDFVCANVTQNAEWSWLRFIWFMNCSGQCLSARLSMKNVASEWKVSLIDSGRALWNMYIDSIAFTWLSEQEWVNSYRGFLMGYSGKCLAARIRVNNFASEWKWSFIESLRTRWKICVESPNVQFAENCARST